MRHRSTRRRPGLTVSRPDGAFYLWINVSYCSGGDVAEWAEGFFRLPHL